VAVKGVKSGLETTIKRKEAELIKLRNRMKSHKTGPGSQLKNPIASRIDSIRPGAVTEIIHSTDL